MGDFPSHTACSCSFRKLDVIMNLDAVVDDRDTSVLHLGGAFKSGSCELDIVGLPGERGKAHVGIRQLEFVEAAAPLGGIRRGFLFPAGAVEVEAKAVEDLGLVAIEGVDTAVAAVLTARAGFGLERESEFNMHLEIAEGLVGLGA